MFSHKKDNSEKITEKKNKKRHRSSKRTKTLLKRRSISSSILQQPNMTGKNKLWLEDLKKELEMDMEFLQSYRVYRTKKKK
jgi:hypothetical protein